MLSHSSSGCHSATSSAHVAAGEACAQPENVCPRQGCQLQALLSVLSFGRQRAAGSPASGVGQLLQVQAPACLFFLALAQSRLHRVHSVLLDSSIGFHHISFLQVQAPLCSQPFSTPGGLQAESLLSHLVYEPKQYFQVWNVMLPEPAEAHRALGFLLSRPGYEEEAISLCV